MRLDVKIFGAHLHGQLPQYVTTGSTGPDLRICIDTLLTIEPGTTYLIPTGMTIHLTDPGYAALVLPHSGMDHKYGIVLGNLVRLIGSDYQSQLMVSTWDHGNMAFVFNPMERFAQLVIVPVAQAELSVVDNFAESECGTGGFGNTGHH